MAIKSNNGTSLPMHNYGASVQYSRLKYGYSVYVPNIVEHLIGDLAIDTTEDISNEQVAGLVPLFACESTECREGKYGSADSDFMLPVFAQNQTSVIGDYYNDTNSFLFNVPADTVLTSHIFYLDKKVSGNWVQQQVINDNSIGRYWQLGALCSATAYIGTQIYWNLVLNKYGEGVYRFRVGGFLNGGLVQSSGWIKFITVSTDCYLHYTTGGYGDLCSPYFIDHTLSVNTLMQNYANAINAYQNSAYATPLFHAVWDSVNHRINIYGLLGQNTILLDNSTFKPNVLQQENLTGGSNTPQTSINCYASPPFCLKTWDCYAVDRTTRFDATYTGGVIGDVNKNNGGRTWTFCCNGIPLIETGKKSSFTLRFFNTDAYLHHDTTFTFGMEYGIDFCTPITVASGTSIVNAEIQIVNAINTYQASLVQVLFTAFYNVTLQQIEITYLGGQNIGYSLIVYPANAVSNTNIHWITSPASQFITAPLYYAQSIGRFGGGIDIDTNILVGAPITWNDSIRIGGEFGYEQTDYERKSIKYQTGVVNKIRDEAILKFTWKSSALPFWFHERFKAYALMADELKVSDYNLNNNDYNIKLFSVQGDSAYNPDYKGYSRKSIVKCEFKAKTQSIYRKRCC